MGLISGDTGPKAVLRRECPSAFAEAVDLCEVRGLFGVERCQSLAILDGNVLLRGLPQGIESYQETVSFVGWKVVDALRAAMHVVVVFDDAAHVTRAKAAEQAKRDAAAKRRVPICSDDLQPFVCPEDDNYGLDELHHPLFSARHLVANLRPARPRFFDAVAQGILGMVTGIVQEEFSLAFDGIDSRGAARPVGETRVGGVLATDDVWRGILERTVPIGEGDLKFTHVCQSVRDAIEVGVAGSLANVMVYMLQTVDTDSLLIETLEQSRRKVRVAESGLQEHVVLCMTERGRKRKGDDHVTPAHILACDIGLMYESLTQRMYGTVRLDEATAKRVPEAFMLLTAAWCLSGTDYCRLQGVRADMALETVAKMVKQQDGTDGIAHLLSPTSEGALLAGPTIERFIRQYLESIESNKRLSRNAQFYTQEHIRKAVFNASYWLGVEHKDVEMFGY